MLKHLLNDSAVLKSVHNVDEYDIPVFSKIKNIPCKFEFAVDEQSSISDSQKRKPARMFCIDDISVGDIISFNSENYKVVQVNSYDDLDGKLMLREVFLKWHY